MTRPTSRPRRLKVGAVSYLNTKPLIYRFAEFSRSAELILDVPSRLADRLASGELDVALIPSIEAFLNPGYGIVSDACIACRGPVMSVKLLSRVPIPAIGSLAMDEGSRTSVALVRILLRQRHGLTPRIEPLPIGRGLDEIEAMTTDAMLVIGDRAIHSFRTGVVDQWDLGEEWCRWTGLPFVFAMWTARQNVDTRELEAALGQARDAGVANLELIAEVEAGRVGLPVAACLSYLRDNLHFTLGVSEQQGLQLFHHFAVEFGLVSPECTPETIGLTVS